MGFAMARAAAAAGADVLLICGPVDLPTPARVQRIDVESATDMYAATHEHVEGVDIFIAAAAVADYSAATVRDNKIKKSKTGMSIELVRTPDILASVAALDEAPFTVGFAAETEKLHQYATAKLEQKNLDMIVANEVGANRGFDSDDNTVEVFWAAGEQSFPKMAKTRLAEMLMRLIAERYMERIGPGSKRRFPAVAARD
jgi:phosphopantothenoylcysteine decarboxylase/phosphopantothenate--cysteine ligase